MAGLDGGGGGRGKNRESVWIWAVFFGFLPLDRPKWQVNNTPGVDHAGGVLKLPEALAGLRSLAPRLQAPGRPLCSGSLLTKGFWATELLAAAGGTPKGVGIISVPTEEEEKAGLRKLGFK